MEKTGKGQGWVVYLVLALVAAAVLILWAARNHGENLYERDELAKRIASVGGHPTCAMAWMKARPDQLNGLTPSAYAPEVELLGPPRIVSCGLIDSNGREKARLKMFERCRDVNMDCVEIID